MERQESQVETEMVSTTLRTREAPQDQPGDHHALESSQRVRRTWDQAGAPAGKTTTRPADQREQAEVNTTESQRADAINPTIPEAPATGREMPRHQDPISQRRPRSSAKDHAIEKPTSVESPIRLHIRPPQMPLSRGEDRRENFERQTGGSPARPIIRVTIGRIEVKAVMQNTAPVATAPRQPVPQPRSLAEYLKERNGEFR
jgi:hypothetical protein